jgi:hypothetical protein
VSSVAETQVIADKVVAEAQRLGYDGLRPHLPKTWRLLGGNVAFERQPFLSELRRSATGAVYGVLARVEWQDRPGNNIALRIEVDDERPGLHQAVMEELIFSPDGSAERK